MSRRTKAEVAELHKAAQDACLRAQRAAINRANAVDDAIVSGVKTDEYPPYVAARAADESASRAAADAIDALAAAAMDGAR